MVDDGRTDDGRRTDGRTTEHGYTISSSCEPDGSGELKKTFKNLLLQNQKANDFETWCEASVTGALQSLYKS